MTGSSATAALGPGAVLAGFRLVEQIGTDGLGELYRAQNLHAPKLLRAIRVIRADLAAQPDFRVQLLQVIELLDGLEHPNLLRLHHLGEEQDVLFTVQDLLLGRTLRALTLEQRTLRPVNVVADWIYQALCGLSHAHHQGVIHQELSLGNRPRRKQEGGDWGMVRELAHCVSLGDRVGSRARWTSPTQSLHDSQPA